MTELGMVLDCADPEVLAQFWAPALGYTIGGRGGAYVRLLPTEPGQPHLLLQRVPEPKSAKNRMHLDIHVADIDAEAERLVSLGATRVSSSPYEERGFHWHLMADPEGNELCVCDGGTGSPSS